MNFDAIFSSKIKVASLLIVLMASIILSNVLEKKMLENSKASVLSIYKDRLKPATDLFEMRQLIANRVYILERIALDKTYKEEVFKEELKEIEIKFEQLINGYEKTFLVPEEKDFLLALKKDLAKLNTLSAEMVHFDENKIAKRLEELKPMSEAINKDLSDLSKVQVKIGEQVLNQYSDQISYSTFLNTIQIVLSIIIGLVVFMFFSNRKITLTKLNPHNLN